MEKNEETNRDANELLYLLTHNTNVRSLIEAHDTIAQKNYDLTEDELIEIIRNNKQQQPHSDSHSFDYRGDADIANIFTNKVDDQNDMLPYYARPPIDAIRMIGIRKVNDEPLGITVRVNENGDLEIARIMHGGMIDKQGLYYITKVILLRKLMVSQ